MCQSPTQPLPTDICLCDESKSMDDGMLFALTASAACCRPADEQLTNQRRAAETCVCVHLPRATTIWSTPLSCHIGCCCRRACSRKCACFPSLLVSRPMHRTGQCGVFLARERRLAQGSIDDDFLRWSVRWSACMQVAAAGVPSLLHRASGRSDAPRHQCAEKRKQNHALTGVMNRN